MTQESNVNTEWLSSGVGLINQFGAFGWWVSFLCGTLLAMLFFALYASVRLRLVQANAAKKWASTRLTNRPE